MDLLLRNHTAVGVLAIPQEDPAAEAAVWGYLKDLAARGAITTPVGTVYGFAEVPQMIARQAAPRQASRWSASGHDRSGPNRRQLTPFEAAAGYATHGEERSSSGDYGVW